MNTQSNNFQLKRIKIIHEKCNIIYHISIFPSKNIISVSDDKSIKIYDINFNIIQTIEKAHEDIIYYSNIKDENNFVTCSKDKTIKTWINQEIFNEKKYILNQSINNAHNRDIYKVIYYSNNKLISCSEDKTVRIWEEKKNKEYQLITSLNHSNSIKSFLLIEDKNILITSGVDGTFLWNLNNYNFIYFLKDVCCHKTNAIERINNDKIIIGSLRMFMKIISIDEKKIVRKFKKDFWCYGIFIMEDIEYFLICAYNYIKVFRKDNFQCVQYIEDAHESSIFGIIALNDCLIISYGAGGLIKVWSF